MTDGHEDRIDTLKRLMCEITPENINSVRVHEQKSHTYSLLGLIMHTLYLSFEVDIQYIVQIIERCCNMGADPNVLMYVEQGGQEFYTVYEFIIMISNLRVYPKDIMSKLEDRLKGEGGVIRPIHASILA